MAHTPSATRSSALGDPLATSRIPRRAGGLPQSEVIATSWNLCVPALAYPAGVP